MAKNKPKITLQSLLILCDIDAYLRRCRPSKWLLREAASDVCDGAFTRGELDELIRKRLLSIVDGRPPQDAWKLCGVGDDANYWTVEFTQRAIALFYPISGDRT